MLYDIITSKRKKISVLIDPDKQDLKSVAQISVIAQNADIDFFLVGGSLISTGLEKTISTIKDNSSKPVVLFPGSVFQISDKADGILFISLISGKNPDLLIGNHIIAAPLLKNSSLEIIPTGYILIDGGKKTSVEYMSNTKPIPSDKTDIAVAVALAGEMTGKKLIYLETGSGATNHVPVEIIKKVKQNITVPIIVGGGIRTEKNVEDVCKAGADIIVVGTITEDNPLILKSFSKIVHRY